MHGTVLIAHRHKEVQKHFADLAEQAGLNAIVTGSGTEALKISQQSPHWAGFIIAPTLNELDGMGLIAELDKHFWSTPILAICDDDQSDLIQTALNLGAQDYVHKDVKAHRFQISLQNAAQLAQKTQFSAPVKKPDAHPITPALQKALSNNTPILIEGAKGTGKSTLAHQLARRSNSDKNVIRVSPHTIDAIDKLTTLKGAFDHTLILDDVDQLDLTAQQKLKNILAAKNFYALIATTTQCLITQCQHHGFDATLYYRLAIHPVRLSSLTENQTELVEQAHHFMHQEAAELGRGPIRISDQASQLLTHHRWPANYTELKWVMARACQLEPGINLSRETLEIVLPQANQALCAANATQRQDKPEFEPKTLETLERDHIAAMLVHFKGRLSEVARQLGIGRATLYRKLARYALSDKNQSAATEYAQIEDEAA